MSNNRGHEYDYAIAKWLAKLREEKKLSQEYLGLQLNKGQSDIAKMENASKRISVLELLSWMAALNVPYNRVEEVLKPIYNDMTLNTNS